MAGLFALERVAQENRSQRQTIVNLICAYLRMPFVVPPAEPGEDPGTHRDLVQEREVRLTAQRLLTTHLQAGDPADPALTFWPDIDLDLGETTLIDFSMLGCTVRSAHFMATQFVNGIHCGHATFTGRADFWRATFLGDAGFDGTRFLAGAHFGKAAFTGHADFSGTTFRAAADFQSASFTNSVTFRRADFAGPPGDLATLTAGLITTVFHDTTFAGGVPDDVARFLPGARRPGGG